MKQPILAVYDSKGGYYWSPITAKSIGDGERSFSNEVNSKQSNSVLSTNPEDFGLYLLGDFDPETGLITPIQQPRQLLLAQAIKQKQDVSPLN